MKNKNIYDKIFEKKCAVCGHKFMADIYDQGECLNCGWYNGKLYSEYPDKVIFSNVISLNKAKLLYKEGKPLKPNLHEFMEMLYVYSEVEFSYKNKDCGLFLIHDKNGEISKIEMGWGPKDNEISYFKDKEDFIQNAKIDGKFVRDIWDEVENPKYM